jgi:hypothetical protein
VDEPLPDVDGAAAGRLAPEDAPEAEGLAPDGREVALAPERGVAARGVSLRVDGWADEPPDAPVTPRPRTMPPRSVGWPGSAGTTITGGRFQ